MSTVENIDNAVKIFQSHDTKFELMEDIVSTYPTKPKECKFKYN